MPQTGQILIRMFTYGFCNLCDSKFPKQFIRHRTNTFVINRCVLTGFWGILNNIHRPHCSKIIIRNDKCSMPIKYSFIFHYNFYFCRDFLLFQRASAASVTWAKNNLFLSSLGISSAFL